MSDESQARGSLPSGEGLPLGYCHAPADHEAHVYVYMGGEHWCLGQKNGDPLPDRRKATTSLSASETFEPQTACPRCGTPRTESPCDRCGTSKIPLPWTTVLAIWRARMEGYEAYKEARTEHNEGDDIWDFYAHKTWSNLLFWKDHFEKAERVLEHVRPYIEDDNFDPSSEWIKDAVTRIDGALLGGKP